MAKPWRLSNISIGLQLRLQIVMALAALAIAGAILLSVWDMRVQTIESAQAEMSNLSSSLADQAHDTFQTLDTILVGLRERVETDGLQAAAAARLRALLALRVRSLGMVHRLAVIDASGRIVVTSTGTPPTGTPAAALALFRHHQGTAGQDAFIGWPIRDLQDGTWELTISRRLTTPDGKFAGLVMAGVPTGFFRQFYRTFDLGWNGAILLARADGILVSRWPMKPSDESRDLRSGELFRRIVTPNDQPRIQHRSLIDDIVRLGSYHWVKGAPVFVLAARDKSDVLAVWRRDTALHLSALAVVLAALWVLTRRLSARIGEGEAVRQLLTDSNARLLKSEAHATRANEWLEMGEQIAQIGHWHIDVAGGNLLTWSDEIYRMYGIEGGGLNLSVDWALAACHPLDRDALTDAVRKSIASGISFETTSRLIRPDGTIRHIATRGVPQTGTSGAVIALFGVMMDITDQKNNEIMLMKAHDAAESANKALAAANLALEVLAMQDALTGLYNRRYFDFALDEAFRRVAGSQKSLALIMVDVDHFKAFNDRYGHQAGDACLRSIAELIASTLTRPGDLGARYGGEEIAVLLPFCTEQEAFELALSIAAAVRDQHIVHGGSPKGVVTISAGVHAITPVCERDQASELVGQADKALYAAKNSGRDKVLCFSGCWVEDQERPRRLSGVAG